MKKRIPLIFLILTLLSLVFVVFVRVSAHGLSLLLIDSSKGALIAAFYHSSIVIFLVCLVALCVSSFIYNKKKNEAKRLREEQENAYSTGLTGPLPNVSGMVQPAEGETKVAAPTSQEIVHPLTAEDETGLTAPQKGNSGEDPTQKDGTEVADSFSPEGRKAMQVSMSSEVEKENDASPLAQNNKASVPNSAEKDTGNDSNVQPENYDLKGALKNTDPDIPEIPNAKNDVRPGDVSVSRQINFDAAILTDGTDSDKNSGKKKKTGISIPKFIIPEALDEDAPGPGDR